MPLLTAPDPTFGNVQRQMQKMIEQMQKNFFNFCPGETWTPNVNLYESETAYIVCADLAGVDKEKIDIEINEHKLIFRGERPAPCPPDKPECTTPQKLRVHEMEIDHGKFVRVVELPQNVDHEKINAQHKNGLLWIELPKK
jgi:HSP20 family protein